MNLRVPSKTSGSFLSDPNWSARAATLTPTTPSRIGAAGATEGPALTILGRVDFGAVAVVAGAFTAEPVEPPPISGVPPSTDPASDGTARGSPPAAGLAA